MKKNSSKIDCAQNKTEKTEKKIDHMYGVQRFSNFIPLKWWKPSNIDSIGSVS